MPHSARRWGLLTTLAGAWIAVNISELPIGAAFWQPAPSVGSTARWTLAAVGDAIITRPIMQFDHEGDPRFRQMAAIIRGADAAFVNLEINFFRLSGFTGWPEVENGGNYEMGPPEAAHDLKAMGFDLFNRANNHSTDYGVEGLRATSRLLDELRLTHAGVGENLGQASRPAYFESTKGRIALIGLATTFTPMSRAGAARPEMMGRPGLNPLRVERRYQVDAATYAALRAQASRLGAGVPASPTAPLRMFGSTIEQGTESTIIETLHKSDEERILREVRNASQQADFVVVNSHSHEPSNDATEPPPWLVEFARKCIDAGATTYVVHGPHQLRGIEIYKGRPIFYSLGNFVFQNETIDPMPSDYYEQFNLPDTALATDVYNARFRNGTSGFPASAVWYESVVAVPVFAGTQVTEIALYPIELGHKAPRAQRGTPRLADESVGRAIVERLAKQSAAFGTTISLVNGIGVWRRSPADAPRP